MVIVYKFLKLRIYQEQQLKINGLKTTLSLKQINHQNKNNKTLILNEI